MLEYFCREILLSKPGCLFSMTQLRKRREVGQAFYTQRNILAALLRAGCRAIFRLRHPEPSCYSVFQTCFTALPRGIDLLNPYSSGGGGNIMVHIEASQS